VFKLGLIEIPLSQPTESCLAAFLAVLNVPRLPIGVVWTNKTSGDTDSVLEYLVGEFKETPWLGLKGIDLVLALFQ
jgi:hypothetical protein